jgi:hypothetical protein
VFFIYGEDRADIMNAKDRSRYSSIRTRGDDLQKVRVDSDLDREGTYVVEIDDLDLETFIYYAIGVEYDNVDRDEEIILGSIHNFKTKGV